MQLDPYISISLCICQDEFLETTKSSDLKDNYTAQFLALDTSVSSAVQMNWLE